MRGEWRDPVIVAATHCETCGGSDNRRAVERMLKAMRQVGWRKLLVAGGSPGTRGELERLCAHGIDLRFVTEETSPNRRTVAPLLDWSDVAAIWASTEISHKATAVAARPQGAEGAAARSSRAGRIRGGTMPPSAPEPGVPCALPADPCRDSSAPRVVRRRNDDDES